ncbi:MAG: YebC/PmpR family DNA-binding transcriptional regulator, partial [Candidatus Colwellbacteria bacterium]|nr:YebC/PmpR family DNA-binding transcriptional regulator [Candidatus Colwellbacteria bacterium]
PGGTAIIIEAITDNRNRTISEIKNILNEARGKFAEPGSVLWVFEKNSELPWQPKFNQEKTPEDIGGLRKLIDEVSQHDDVQNVYHN